MTSGLQKTQQSLLRQVIDDTTRAEAATRNLAQYLGPGTTLTDVALKRTEELAHAILELSVCIRNTVRVVNAVVDDL